MSYSRRLFLARAGIASFSAIPIFHAIRKSPLKSIGPGPLPPELVEEFVRVAHSDFDKVKEMLEETPNLLNATQDWGDGDFETAIGAAGHMGYPDMANYLIQKGARFDIFVLTMLGKTAIVKETLELYPNLLNSIGPHGFTLLHHAEKGGEPAQELYDFFIEQGLTETFIRTYEKE